MGRRPMITIAYDPSLHVLCGRVSGPQSNAENEKLLAAVDELDRDGRAQKHPVAFMLDLTNNVEPPDAHWRRRFADQRKRLGSPAVFISIVTTSRVLRGVLTAMNWISPEAPHVKSVHHATCDESAAWIEQVHGAPAAAVRNLLTRKPASPTTNAGSGPGP